jgi:hypothetical protein
MKTSARIVGLQAEMNVLRTTILGQVIIKIYKESTLIKRYMRSILKCLTAERSFWSRHHEQLDIGSWQRKSQR